MAKFIAFAAAGVILVLASAAIWKFRNVGECRLLLVMLIFAGLIAFVGLKQWQLFVERSPDWFACGICRRVDDVSWWSGIILFAMSVFIAAGVLTPIVFLSRGAATIWLISSAIGIAIYLYGVSRSEDPGTFFSKAAGKIYLIQSIEGVLAVLGILVGHFFLVLMCSALLQISPKSSNVGKGAPVLAGLLALGCFVILLLNIDKIRATAAPLCKDCGELMIAPKAYLVLGSVVAIWWPLLILLPIWVRTAILYAPEILLGGNPK